MRFCFILEEKYAHKPMPMVVADQLQQWGHEIEVLQPYAAITNLTDLCLTSYDAYVLKTVSDGPGLTILEAAEQLVFPRSIIHARFAWYVTSGFSRLCPGQRVAGATHLFCGPSQCTSKVPHDMYPIVVKPAMAPRCRMYTWYVRQKI